MIAGKINQVSPFEGRFSYGRRHPEGPRAEDSSLSLSTFRRDVPRSLEGSPVFRSLFLSTTRVRRFRALRRACTFFSVWFGLIRSTPFLYGPVRKTWPVASYGWFGRRNAFPAEKTMRVVGPRKRRKRRKRRPGPVPNPLRGTRKRPGCAENTSRTLLRTPIVRSLFSPKTSHPYLPRLPGKRGIDAREATLC